MRKTAWISAMVLGILVLYAPAAFADHVYKVQKGDSIWKIARQNGVSVDELIEINQLKDENSLQIGDRLRIPDDEKNTGDKTPAPPKPQNPEPVKAAPQPAPSTVVGVQTQSAAGETAAAAPAPVAQSVEASRGLDINANLIKSIVNTAVKHIGTPYHYGGTSPRGFDCSGFVRYVFDKCGINLPHQSGAMAGLGTHVDKSDLRTGDLVFFETGGSHHINHVGIYIGGGRFIHASTHKGITITPLTDRTYTREYAGARRIID